MEALFWKHNDEDWRRRKTGNGEGLGTVLTLYQRFRDLPFCATTHHQSWEVCRGRRRAHRTNAVPSPTSPLLHNPPKAGNCLGQSSSWTVLGCGPKLVLILLLHVSQPCSAWRHYCWAYADSRGRGSVERPSRFFDVNFKDLMSL